jgi:hypothetical protein
VVEGKVNIVESKAVPSALVAEYENAPQTVLVCVEVKAAIVTVCDG